jgi:hypothetical protein
MSTITITYTFPADCKIPQLRGRTFTVGEFCYIDSAGNQDPDAVRFAERVDGKAVVARIKGKPELEAALAASLAAKAAVVGRLAAMGWPQYEAAQDAMIAAREAYDRASEHGYPVREARAAESAEQALAAAAEQYPMAALYARAGSYSHASHDQKSSAGLRAMRAIEGGADPVQAVATMVAEWQAAAERAVQNA